MADWQDCGEAGQGAYGSNPGAYDNSNPKPTDCTRCNGHGILYVARGLYPDATCDPCGGTGTQWWAQ